ncbi:MAG: NgoFVII family restriction endonuclease [Crenarchaeota archaeon]|nr:NgoFVII family restriction endonuclease [Thermoproteota archaeon]
MLCAAVAIAIALSSYFKAPLLRLLLNTVIIYQGYAGAAALIALSMRRSRIAKLAAYPSASPKVVSRTIPISSTVGYSTTYQPPRPQLKIVPPERMIHSKIYIGDDTAIVGSANLTKAGLWRNYETITIFEGDEVKEIEKMFLEIWSAA